MSLELEIIDRLDISEDSAALRLVYDEETELNQYEIVGFERFKESAIQTLEFIKNRDLEEDDRKSLAKTRAAVNKYSDRVNEIIKSAQGELFGKVESQKKEARSLLDSITSTLKMKIDEFDRMARAEKQEMFSKEIARRQEYQSELEDLDVFDVIDASWLNRSSSDKKALEELKSRLDSISKLAKSDLCKSSDASEICGILQAYDWSELQTIEFLNAKYSPVEKIEEMISSEDEQTEEKIAEEKIVEKEIVRLEINSEDFEKLINILNLSEIEYKLV